MVWFGSRFVQYSWKNGTYAKFVVISVCSEVFIIRVPVLWIELVASRWSVQCCRRRCCWCAKLYFGAPSPEIEILDGEINANVPDDFLTTNERGRKLFIVLVQAHELILLAQTSVWNMLDTDNRVRRRCWKLLDLMAEKIIEEVFGRTRGVWFISSNVWHYNEKVQVGKLRPAPDDPSFWWMMEGGRWHVIICNRVPGKYCARWYRYVPVVRPTDSPVRDIIEFNRIMGLVMSVKFFFF